MAGFGGAVKLTGESEYRKALKQITQNLKEVNSEMKLVTATYGKNNTSQDALSAKTEVLNKKLEAQKSKVETLKKQYSDMAKQYDTNKEKNDALAKKYDEEAKKLETIGNELETTSDEYQEQADVVDDLKQQLDKSTTAQEANEKAMSDMRTQINNAQADVANTENAISDLSSEMDDSASSADDLGDSVADAGNEAESASNGGFTVFKGALADIVANVVTTAISKLKELAEETIQVGADFESSMSKVQALSGASDEELASMTATAKKWGSQTKYSATECADALGYMALAGWSADESTEALGGVLQLASASGMDLAEASDLVTDYLSAFGLTASDSAKFADELAYAQANSNTTTEQLGEAFKNCSANMSSAGQTVETTTSILASLANSGLKGSEAGTALSAIMRDLTSSMEDGAIKIGDTSVAVQDSNGNFRSLTDILADVETATEGMGTAQKASALQATFTSDSIKGLNLILNSGVSDISDFEDALSSCDGTASDMSDTMNDNLNGDMTELGSKIEGVQIALYEKLEPALRAGVEAMSGLVDVASWIVDHGTEVIAVLAGIGAGVGAYVAYTTALKVMQEGWEALTIVTKAQAVAQGILNAVMSANPIGLIIMAVAGLVTAFVILWNKSEGFRNFWIGLWENIKAIAEPVIEFFKTAFTTAWDAIKTVWSAVVTFFKAIWTGIKAIFTPAVEFYRTIFYNAFTIVKNIWIVASTLFKTIWNAIKMVLKPVIEFFKTLFGGAYDKVKEIWNKAKSFFEGIWNKIKAPFEKVKDFFSGVFGDAWDAIKDAFSTVGDFFKGIWTTIKGVFSNIGQKVGNAIGSAFKTAINSALATIENVLNAPITAINNLIDLINKLPGVSLSKLKTFSLPRLAKGGVVNSATVAEIGEAGAEAVVPLENNLGWITKIAESLAKSLTAPLSTATKDALIAGNYQQNSYNDTVEAFKDALGQMKIVLDDEEMGHFIEKTVADAIYT